MSVNELLVANTYDIYVNSLTVGTTIDAGSNISATSMFTTTLTSTSVNLVPTAGNPGGAATLWVDNSGVLHFGASVVQLV